jgi:cytoskeleton protein RodZ
MTDPNHAEETVAPVPASSGAGPGILIRRARERAMMSQDELAAQLRLSRATLDALEHDDFAALSEPVYVRGYYRKCAKFLNLSEAELLSAYDRVAVRRTPPAPTKLLLAGNSDGGRSGVDMRLVPWGAGIAVAVAIGVFALHKHGDSGVAPVEGATAAAGSVSVPATTPAAPANPAVVSGPAPAEPPVSAGPSSTEAAVPAAPLHAAPFSSTLAPVPTAAPAHVAAAAAESPTKSAAVPVLTSAPAANPSQAAKMAPHVASIPAISTPTPEPVAPPARVAALAPPPHASASAPASAVAPALKTIPHAASAAVLGPAPAVAPSRVAAAEVRHHNSAQSGNDRSGSTAVAVAAPPKPEAPEMDVSTTAAPSDAHLPLEVSIHETSWVHIEDANGRLLLSRMMHPGDTQRVLGAPPYSVFVGYAPGVDLHYGDASVDLQPYSRDNSTARLKVPVEESH